MELWKKHYEMLLREERTESEGNESKIRIVDERTTKER